MRIQLGVEDVGVNLIFRYLYLWHVILVTGSELQTFVHDVVVPGTGQDSAMGKLTNKFYPTSRRSLM